MSRITIKTEYVVLLGSIIGFLMVTDYYVQLPQIASVAVEARRWTTVIASFGVIAGTINVLQVHGGRIRKKVQKQWYFSIILLAVLFAVTLGGLILSPASAAFGWWYSTIFVPLDGSTFALLGFFIISAAFRAFRVRNVDAFLLLAAGIFVTLGQAPIGGAIWGGITDISNWLLDYGMLTGLRGFMIGVGLGTIVYSFRILIGRAREVYGGG